jgi:hypothetical protein
MFCIQSINFFRGPPNEWGKREMPIGYWWENQKETDHWEDQDVGGWTISKWILEK